MQNASSTVVIFSLWSPPGVLSSTYCTSTIATGGFDLSVHTLTHPSTDTPRIRRSGAFEDKQFSVDGSPFSLNLPMMASPNISTWTPSGTNTLQPPKTETISMSVIGWTNWACVRSIRDPWRMVKIRILRGTTRRPIKSKWPNLMKRTPRPPEDWCLFWIISSSFDVEATYWAGYAWATMVGRTSFRLPQHLCDRWACWVANSATGTAVLSGIAFSNARFSSRADIFLELLQVIVSCWGARMGVLETIGNPQPKNSRDLSNGVAQCTATNNNCESRNKTRRYNNFCNIKYKRRCATRQ